jgi:hypothetical protein
MAVNISGQPAASILMVQEVRVKIEVATSSKMCVTENCQQQ